jgi:5-formyltetrahydrofolate cyclo-ligase
MMAKDSEKARLREAASAKRRALPVAERERAAQAVARHAAFIAGIAAGRTVSGFATFGDELDTGPLLSELDRLAVRLTLPVVGRRGHPLIFRPWRPGDETVPGPFGIPQPLPEAGTAEPTVFLVPLLAFDRRGYRLGYGGGFYDRTLAAARAHRHIVALGLALAIQEVAAVPTDPFDEPVDGVLTECETIRCTGGARAAALPW